MDRQKSIVWTSAIGIITNILLVGFKLTVGIIAGSIAIILDAVNNFTDVLSSTVTIIGTKLAARSPDDGHPYGHGRIEYLTTLLVGIIIFSTGIMALVESVPKVIHPELADYSWATIVVVVAATFVKLALGTYVRRAGKRLDSSSLVASGIDALFDALLSFATLIGIIVTLTLHISIDGILGVLISVFILKTSLEVLFEASNEILGRTASHELIRGIKETIMDFSEVSGVYDLMLHNYGPSEFIGSVQIQVPDQLTAKQIHRLTQEIAHAIYSKYDVNLTIGIYAENSDEPAHREIRSGILTVTNQYPEIRQVHGLYIDDERKQISFDLVMGSHCTHQIEVRDQVIQDLSGRYPDYQYLITLDTDFGN